jgi:hypothetical protein
MEHSAPEGSERIYKYNSKTDIDAMSKAQERTLFELGKNKGAVITLESVVKVIYERKSKIKKR